MATFKLRKAQSLGSLAAENDAMLQDAFVDAGVLEALKDTSDSRFLVLGRTGAGKTALLRQIGTSEQVGKIDPEELSMQHLHNSTILPKLVAAGVNLDVFYKFLWRHVCVLELIRLRYREESDVPATVNKMFDVWALVSADRRQHIRKEKERREREKETKTTAKSYLETYGAEYWIKTDTRIKTITTELETKLEENGKLGTKIGVAAAQLTIEATTGASQRDVAGRARDCRACPNHRLRFSRLRFEQSSRSSRSACVQ